VNFVGGQMNVELHLFIDNVVVVIRCSTQRYDIVCVHLYVCTYVCLFVCVCVRSVIKNTVNV